MASPAAVRRCVAPLATPRARSLEAALRTLCFFVASAPAARAPLGPGSEVPLSLMATMPSTDIDASAASTPLSSFFAVAPADDSDRTVLTSVAAPRPLVTSPSGSSTATFYSGRSVVTATMELYLCRRTSPIVALKIKSPARAHYLLVAQSDGGGSDCYGLVPFSVTCMPTGTFLAARPRVILPSGSPPVAMYSYSNHKHVTFPVATPKIKSPARAHYLLVAQSDGGGGDCYGLVPFSVTCMPTGTFPAARPRVILPSGSPPVAMYSYRNHKHVYLYRGTFPVATPKRVSCLSPVITSGKRHYSNWAWTPWAPTRPKDTPPKDTPKPQVDAAEIAKFISKLDVDSEEGVELKTMLLEKFYAEGTAKGESIDLKLDLLLHRQEVTNQMLKSLCAGVKKEKPKRGTFVIFGKRIELSSILAVVGLF